MLGYYVGSSVRVALGFGCVSAFHVCYPRAGNTGCSIFEQRASGGRSILRYYSAAGKRCSVRLVIKMQPRTRNA